MPLSWNEIRSNAQRFAVEWASETREHAEAKTFWDDFFRVFGLTRRHLASFEEPVKGLKGHYGFIDLFWKGMLLAEHKSAGKDLGKAHAQAMDYIQSLQREGRRSEVPRFVIVSDFRRMALHDLDEDRSIEFELKDFPRQVDSFGFIPGYQRHVFAPQDPINIEAVEIMGRLHDALEEGGYKGHELERFLVRILFCLFAEDTGIFERNSFQFFIEDHTRPDGSDLGAQLAQLFFVLNTPEDRRQANLLEELARLPYVNGELFAEHLSFASFNTKMRDQLHACTQFDWSRISPAVFGALFQSVMEPAERRQIGAHYTSETDIMKVIGPLFLDDLKESLEAAKNDVRKLRAVHERIANIRLLDPACGCGNFLVVAYRELRVLELEILKRLQKGEKIQSVFDIEAMLRVDVDQMYGIEIDEWPSRIAEVAIWLIDHQMNNLFSAVFGEYYVRLPLKRSPHIRHGNALTIDWNDVLPSQQCSFVLGNPPFVGSKFQTAAQRAEVKKIVGEKVKGVGLLDYVTAWYVKAAHYIKDTGIRVAFVSTNSITQGEQVGVLWGELLKIGVRIQFAHRTFSWQSEARGAAHVHVVIIGFAVQPSSNRRIFDYEHIKSDPVEVIAKRINPFLVDADNVLIVNRNNAISAPQAMVSGNQPIDGGNYLFTPDEKDDFICIEPGARHLFKIWLGGFEFLNGIERWCLYLKNAEPHLLRTLPNVMERIDKVKAYRLQSDRGATKKLASTPTRFQVEVETGGNYLALPEVSSERRNVIPIAFLTSDVVCGNKLRLMPNAGLWEFGVMTSSMHMAWVRQVSGRLKSDYQYSIKLVYNNFPWPESLTEAQKKAVEAKAQAVLDVRVEFPDATLADLYDPLIMPPKLLKAHTELDRAVEKCYRSKPFKSDRERVEFLFELYQKYTAPLLKVEKKATGKKKQ
jgi:hypothetical protein